MYTVKRIVQWFNRDSELKIMLKLLQIQVNNIELYVSQQRYIDNSGQASGFQAKDSKAFDGTGTWIDMEEQTPNAGVQPINLFPL